MSNRVKYKSVKCCFFLLFLVVTGCTIVGGENIELNSFKSYMNSPIYQNMINEVESYVVAYSGSDENLSNAYSRFTIGHCSDVHAFADNSVTNLKEFIQFFHRPLIQNRVDLLLCTGDLSNGHHTFSKEQTLKEIDTVVGLLCNQDIPAMLLIGNHDSNINETSVNLNVNVSYNNSISKPEQYRHIIKKSCEKWNFENKDETGYYYKDFPNYKIRIIALDFVDYPIIKDGDSDQIKYKMQHVFSQKQLEWFYNILINTPEDFGVIVASHALPDSKYIVGKWEQGVHLLTNIIHAYQTGTSYNHSWICSNYPELSTSLDFDFSALSKGDFICWIGGHTHRRSFSYEVINNVPQLMITTSALYTQQYNSETISGYYSPTIRESKTILQNSFNIIQIDRIKRNVIVSIYGAYLNYSETITDRLNILHY